MATLADLKTRIAEELVRDDMGADGDNEDTLARAIDSAISYYADELQWFNDSTGTASTVAATATVSLPTGMRYATQVSYSEEPLTKATLDDILIYDDTGQPSHWAMDGDVIRLFPIPDAVYALSVQGVADFDDVTFPPEHYDLIAARTKVILCRFPLRDPEGLALARDEERDALDRVRRESRKRRSVPLRTEFGGRSYNINTDC
jgi:hypothetical protein